jgi:hypothetical protein
MIDLIVRGYAFPLFYPAGKFILGLFVPDEVPVDMDGGGIGAKYEFAL